MSAYACEPNTGSEPGAGWNWALAAARQHDVVVLTRANNREVIEAELARTPTPSLRFRYLDLPPWAKRWKRGERGIRIYYTLWQLLVAREVRRLQKQQLFDLVHHVTFASLWLPALACIADAPFVLGPVGGGPRVPIRLYAVLGVRGSIRELLLGLYRAVQRRNPFVQLSWRRAAVIVVQNPETLSRLPPRLRNRAVIRPNASVPPSGVHSRGPVAAEPVAVCAGRLLPWKGLALAIEALVVAPSWRLVLIGSGPDRERLVRLAERLGVADRVRFVSWLPQDAMWRELKAADAFLLPSLRDDAPLSCVEAEALGLPVIAFDQGGPSVLGRFPGARFLLVPRGSRRDSARGLAAALEALKHDPPRAAGADFGLDGVERDLGWIYERALTRPGAVSVGQVLS
jgi:glycosyltransferase involved in cell wall biosynthesis